MNDSRWALILGASSGFGEAAALAFAKAGYDIYGVHLDLRHALPRVAKLQERIGALGRQSVFFNLNAAEDDKRTQVLDRIAADGARVRVLLHSIAFGALKPLVGGGAASRRQIEVTCDTMGHSLVYWTRDLVARGLLGRNGRVFAMTSAGAAKAIPAYGPVAAAKAVLEAHVRQLALELAPAGITVNAVLAGVTDTSALRKVPGHAALIEKARAHNPHGRLTTPEDVAHCLVALCDEGTYWMTGNTLQVDGGEGIAG